MKYSQTFSFYTDQGDSGQWEGYHQDEQQWYGTEGAYHEGTEQLSEHPYPQEQQHYPQEQQHYPQRPVMMDSNVPPQNYPQQPAVVEQPVPVHEEHLAPTIPVTIPAVPAVPVAPALDAPNLITQLAAKANPALMLEMSARGIGEKELLSFLGAQLTEFAKTQGLGYQEPAKVEPEPVKAPEVVLPKPVLPPQPPVRTAQPPVRTAQARVQKPKPLKSILKKGNPVSLKPPSKEGNSSLALKTETPEAGITQTIGQECIIRISDRGPERYFCKLCQCHIESVIAKELHTKSMKHIELFVREKSSLLQSVIGSAPTSTAPSEELQKEPLLPHRDTEALNKPDREREITPEEKRDSSRRDQQKTDERADKYGDSSEDDTERQRLMDYDRLRLREWRLRESTGSVEPHGDESDHKGKDEYSHERREISKEAPSRGPRRDDYRSDYSQESEEYSSSVHDDKPRQSWERYPDHHDDHADYDHLKPYPPDDQQRYSEQISRDYESDRHKRRPSEDRESNSSKRSVVSMSIDGSEHDYRPPEVFDYSSNQYPPYKNERDMDMRSQSREREYRHSLRDSQRLQDDRKRERSYDEDTVRQEHPKRSRDRPPPTGRQREMPPESTSQLPKFMNQPQSQDIRQKPSNRDRTASANKVQAKSGLPKQAGRLGQPNQASLPGLSVPANNSSTASNNQREVPVAADRLRREIPPHVDSKQPNEEQTKMRPTNQSNLKQEAGKSRGHHSQTSSKDSRDRERTDSARDKTSSIQQKQDKSVQPQQNRSSSERKMANKPSSQSSQITPNQKSNVVPKPPKETDLKTPVKNVNTNTQSSAPAIPSVGQPISTLTPGQSELRGKRVPPPPPPYNQGSGPQKGHAPQGRGGNPRGRGGFPPLGRGQYRGRGRGGYQSHSTSQPESHMNPPSQSGAVTPQAPSIMGVAPPQSRGPPQMGGHLLPGAGPPQRSGHPTASRGPPQMGGYPSSERGPVPMGGYPPSDRGQPQMGRYPPSDSFPHANRGRPQMGGPPPQSRGPPPPMLPHTSPPKDYPHAGGQYYGNQGRGQPGYRGRGGRGGSPQMRGSPQFAGRARGGQGYHGQRW